ncbi:MAG: helix-hairpin-helix domain-containing protein [Crocinitomicaceae bacterium]
MSISKRNKRGIWVLIFTCISLAYIPRVLASWTHEPIHVSYETLVKAEEDVDKQQELKAKNKKRKYQQRESRYQGPKSRFNPNEYSKEDWMQLGLSSKQADVVLKFTVRGVKSNEELKKIFVIPEEVFALIEDSTFYPTESFADSFKESNQFKEVAIVDINTANFEELKSLPGIGDFYAKKIIERRKELGGYIGKQQLLELWKFDAEKLDKIEGRISTSGNIQKLNINTADFETLNKHPYISYKVANSIVKMRAAHGEYHQLDDLLKSVLIDRELFTKIQPYLTL